MSCVNSFFDFSCGGMRQHSSVCFFPSFISSWANDLNGYTLSISYFDISITDICKVLSSFITGFFIL
jgi:hypothetical protein